MKSNKKKNNTLLIIILSLILIIAASAVLLVFLTLLGNGFKITYKLLLTTLKGPYYWKLLVVGFIALLGFLGAKLINRMGKKTKDFTEGEDASFFTKKEMKKSEQFNLTKYSCVNESEDGVLLGAKKHKRNIDLILTREPQHTLVVGTTGSGKTSGFLDPKIQVLAKTKTKPSLIITDPKGELYEKHSKMLKERGYKTYVLDLIEPYQSIRWNPFSLIISQLEKLEKIDQTIKDGKEEQSNDDLQIEKKVLEDDIYQNAVDLMYAVCPIEEKSKDPSWQKGARDFILAVVLAFIEDCEKGILDREKLTLFNVYHNISNYAKGNVSVLKRYLGNRGKFSHVPVKAATVLNSAESEKTLASYLTDVASYMQWLTDRGVQTLTSSNELDFHKFDEEPSALFIKIPDEKETRHVLVSLLITQCYKILVDKARKNEANRLKRRLYFLLDEFGNLPKFERLGPMISVARSRWIYFTFIVQNYEQLDNTYGSNVAKIAKDNCPVKIFLGTDSIPTMEEFIKLAGKRKGDSVSVSTGSGDGKGSTSTSVKEISLLTISDLKTLNNKDDFGNAVVSAFGYPVFISKYTPSWKVKYYILGREGEFVRNKKLVDLTKNVFDIKDFVDVRDEMMKDLKVLRQEKAGNKQKPVAVAKKEPKKAVEKPVLAEPAVVAVDKESMLKSYLTDSELVVFKKMSKEEKKDFLSRLLSDNYTNIGLQMLIKELLKDYEEVDENENYL